MKPELAGRQGGIAGHHPPFPGEAMKPGPAAPAPRPAATTRQRLVFAGAAALFVGWLGYLGYLGLTAQTPVVLSRPQFLVSALDVIVALDQVGEGPRQVTVKQVLWSATEEGRKLAGTAVTVTNLDHCDGWEAPGEYLVPLTPDGAGRWQVPGTPRSPGFDPDTFRGLARPRIYPVTEKTLRQHAAMARP